MGQAHDQNVSRLKSISANIKGMFEDLDKPYKAQKRQKKLDKVLENSTKKVAKKEKAKKVWERLKGHYSKKQEK